MNKTGLTAKIRIKYVLPTCIWKYFWRISRYFAFFWEFRGISRKYLNFAGPRPREISEALSPNRVLEKRPSVGAEVWIFLDPSHNAKYADSILTTLKKK